MGQYTGEYPRNWLNPLTDIPPYFHKHRRPGKEDNWNSNVAGLSKRDLLKDVLSVLGTENSFSYFAVVLNENITLGRSKTLQRLATEWQDILKKATNDDAFC